MCGDELKQLRELPTRNWNLKLLLANPAGLWALLAIPAVLLIHFLQERSRRVRVSTLFLLERVKPESVGGARFDLKLPGRAA